MMIPSSYALSRRVVYFAIRREGCTAGRPCGLVSPALPLPDADTVFIALPVLVTAMRTLPPPLTVALRVVAIVFLLLLFRFQFFVSVAVVAVVAVALSERQQFTPDPGPT